MEPVNDAPQEVPDHAAREGEPTCRIATAPLADGTKGVLLQFLANGIMAGHMMRPAVARWVGEQLIGAAQAAESRIVVAGPSDVQQLKNMNGHGG